MRFMEVSAKTGNNVSQGFEMLVEEIHKKFESKEKPVGTAKGEVTLGKSEEKDRKNCQC